MGFFKEDASLSVSASTNHEACAAMTIFVEVLEKWIGFEGDRHPLVSRQTGRCNRHTPAKPASGSTALG
jgi:hypothetical protein